MAESDSPLTDKCETCGRVYEDGHATRDHLGMPLIVKHAFAPATASLEREACAECGLPEDAPCETNPTNEQFPPHSAHDPLCHYGHPFAPATASVTVEEAARDYAERSGANWAGVGISNRVILAYHAGAQHEQAVAAAATAEKDARIAELDMERDRLESALEGTVDNDYRLAFVAEARRAEAAEARIKGLVEALTTIAKREGRFLRDHLTHCENTVEDMGAVADEALATFTIAATEEGSVKP